MHPKSSVLKRREPRAYKLEELLSLPTPEFLIKGIIQRNSLSVLYGSPGSGKTFIALDMALHIATGRPWCDMETQYGQVIYVAAEGYMSVLDRVRAWCKFYQCEPPENMLMVIDPIDLMGEWQSLEEFLTHIVGSAESEVAIRDEYGDIVDTQPAPPVQLIVFDTLARCAYNADENSAQDMGKIVRWLDMLRDKDSTGLDTAVMVLHHSAKHFAHERGSGALRGAADTMLFSKKSPEGPMLCCSKQKSAREFEPIPFTLANLSEEEAVLVHREKVDLIAPERVGPALVKTVKLGHTQLRVLRAIAENAGPEGIAPVELARIVGCDMPQMVRIKSALVRYGYISAEFGSRLYKLTSPGLRALQEQGDDGTLHLEVVHD